MSLYRSRWEITDEYVATEFVECGNANHPDGRWHPATPHPIPGPFGWAESIRQWWRKRKWGCPCRPTHPDTSRTEGEGAS